MAKKKVKSSKFVFTLAKSTLGRYLDWFFRIEHENLHQVKVLQEPYLILGNHTNFWDPVLVNSPLPSQVYYVTSDEYFRNPILKVLLGMVGAIPKTKFMSDAESVKEVIRVKNRGGNIGVFPEGRRNWDGHTLEILYPTAKLAKMLKIPVVTALLKGAALSFPRWAKKPRRGKLIITYNILLTADEVMQLTVDDIYEQICKALAHDEYAFQRQMMIPYTAKALAERLELFLFACPNCQQMGTMQSEDDRFFCEHCSYQTRYTEYGFFANDGGVLHFDNPQDWNFWQLDLLKSKIRQAENDPTPAPILQEDHVLLFKGTRLNPLTLDQAGALALYPDRLIFTNPAGVQTTFEQSGIHGLNIQYNDRFEFYYDKTLYRFIYDQKIVSAYQWVEALRMIQSDNEQKEKVSI